jgi:ubiquinone/menaquinone biosynthesis C-methylase UbiE
MGGKAGDPVVDLVSEHLSPGGTAADLGCGSGRYCGALAGIASTVYCVDANGFPLAIARKRTGSPRAVFLREDMRSTSIPHSSVDLVLLSRVFHDIRDKGTVIREILRILRPGGTLMIVEFRPGLSLGGPPPWLRLPPEEVLGHLGEFGRIEVRDLGRLYAVVARRPWPPPSAPASRTN